MAKKKQKEYGEGPLHLITNLVFWFVLSNLYFILCILPFAIYVMITFMTEDPFQSFKDTSLILYLLSLFVGPALAALYSTMGKFIREKEIEVTKDYFKYYKMNFKQSFIVWGIQMTANFLIYVNFIFYDQFSFGMYIKPIILTVGIFINVLAMVALPILSRFYFSLKDLFRCAFYYGIKKIYITIGTIIMFFIAFVILNYVSQLILFVFSTFAYFVMLLYRPMLNDVEKVIKKA